MNTPTQQAYTELQFAYDYWNEHLFNSTLPSCLITLQREKKTYGYFSYNRFTTTNGQTTDEIALNPSYFAECGLQEIMQTLVHEMCHLWQYRFGNAGRRGYHNKEWAKMMEGIGLMPSHNGLVGGRKTGDSMMDYVIEGGKFHEYYLRLIGSAFRVSWIERHPHQEKFFEYNEENTIEVITEPTVPTKETLGTNTNTEEPIKNKSNRVKYNCPTCLVNVWGKPDINIICGDCNERFVEN